jgi:hypothetical protein
MQRVFDFLRSDDITPIARRTFALERANLIIWSLVLGAIEGNLAGIVVSKTFHASEFLTNVVWAAPIFMMTVNIIWGVVIRGRPRARLLVFLTTCAAVLVCSIGFTSPEWQPWGGWVFAGQIALTHLFVTGIVTLRSSIWQVNYPDTHRGRIIGRLQTIRFLFVPISGAAVAAAFDTNPQYYRLVYPGAAMLALLALLPLRRFRIRRERREIREYREHLARSASTAETRTGLWAGVKEAGAILRRDHAYRRYMVAQFTLGSANFFTDPVLLVIVTGQLGLDYLPANLIMAIIPGLCSWLAIRFWGPYFDRVGVLRFRAVNCTVWVAAYTCVAVSMLIIGTSARPFLWIAIPILVLARVLKGVAHGGGLIAWSIGHLHFARRNQVDLYMSIHVGLTGVRALSMPFLGLLANYLLGNASFVISIFVAFAALLLYRRLADEDTQVTPADDSATSRRDAPTTGANIT